MIVLKPIELSYRPPSTLLSHVISPQGTIYIRPHFKQAPQIETRHSADPAVH